MKTTCLHQLCLVNIARLRIYFKEYGGYPSQKLTGKITVCYDVETNKDNIWHLYSALQGTQRFNITDTVHGSFAHFSNEQLGQRNSQFDL